jgi:diguanylate cyclase (GGDEF)-like protein
MRSFRKRLLVLIIGLIVVTQTVTLAAVLASTRRTVEARSWEQLRAGAELAEQLVRFRAGQLANGVSVLAADFGFREAVASGHVPTILSAAGNNAKRIGADLVVVLDTRGRVLATTVPLAADAGGSLASLLADSGSGREQPRFQVFGPHTYQVFLAPVRTPETIAWVLMGFIADQTLAERIHELVGSEVEIVAHGHDGALRSASTLRAARAAGASGAIAAAEDGERVTHVNDVAYLSFARRLDARGDPVDVVLLKPLQDVFAPYRELRDAMLVIDGVALILAALVGAILGRSATRPIGELVLAARRIEKGQYQTAVRVGGGDEFRALAATFNTMQQNIAAREADITYQAEHDPLTQLPNRLVARRTLAALDTVPERASALILMELRNLPDINASLGHQVGDEVLREVARRLQQNVAPTDTIARVGETQFLAIARDCSAERALLYAEQLAATVCSGFHSAGISLDLRVACGRAPGTGSRRSADELLQRAQVALEEADETRARAAVYRVGQEGEHRRRLLLITELRAAIDQDALSLVYQPKVDMATRSVKSLEALVRWSHPQLGAVPPAEFVPLAERTGGSRPLTNWVLAAALRQLGTWRRMGLNLELAVNLSAPDILDPDLSDAILRLLRSERVEPGTLILEITESAVMRDPRAAARNMQLLRIAGVRFSMDDFGTGHSSLSQLSVLPLDELKIDRSFISQAEPSAVTIVTPDGQPHVVTFDAAANGESVRISSDTTASARLAGGTLQATFKGPTGRSDAQTCDVSADRRQMTCRGVLTNGDQTVKYVDVYDRM